MTPIAGLSLAVIAGWIVREPRRATLPSFFPTKLLSRRRRDQNHDQGAPRRPVPLFRAADNCWRTSRYPITPTS
jgi:hypothetical protein